MKNQENTDTFNLAADTIIKWYEQTHITMTIAKKPLTLINSELMGILLAARKQTLGALTTLANKHILPTHALLRVIMDIYAVLLWALDAPKNGDEEAYQKEVWKRLRQWDYTRITKDKALLEDLCQTKEIKSTIKKIDTDIEKLQNNGIKQLPNYKQLFQNLGRDKKECEELYARTYRQYSKAVHLNRNITQKLSWIQDEQAVLYKDDIEPDNFELMTIVSASCDINKAIRNFYGWHSDTMQKEYDQLLPELVKNKNSVVSVSSVAIKK
ncbi:MAG: DUF5677 domain-containing protein [Anaerohalosphaeraceae bacterium]|nr:DUF5677 domain-containing protein [Anaerohalosphaeraceae bacterium]